MSGRVDNDLFLCAGTSAGSVLTAVHLTSIDRLSAHKN